MGIRYIDKRVKPQVDQPIEQPVTQAPSGPVINDKYRNTAATQSQAEATIQRVLAHCSVEVAAEVIRRAAGDERFDPASRAGLDPEGKALQANLDEITREVENAGFRKRLDEIRKPLAVRDRILAARLEKEVGGENA